MAALTFVARDFAKGHLRFEISHSDPIVQARDVAAAQFQRHPRVNHHP
jgi:hypothetical protein